MNRDEAMDAFLEIWRDMRRYERGILEANEVLARIEEVAKQHPAILRPCAWALAATGPKGWMGSLRQRLAFWLLRTA